MQESNLTESNVNVNVFATQSYVFLQLENEGGEGVMRRECVMEGEEGIMLPEAAHGNLPLHISLPKIPSPQE